MDQTNLFRLLREDAQATQFPINAMEKSIAALIGVLGEQLPKSKQTLDAISAELGNALNQQRIAQGNTVDYFAGRGPVARKLREHLMILRWLAGIEGAALQAELERKLQLFDFRPTEDVEVVNDINAFYNEALLQVRGGVFLSPYPQLEVGTYGPDHFQTGLYGNPGPGADITLVLRVGQPGKGNMQTIFMARPGTQPMIWHYHPWEDYWLQPQEFSLTFVGLKELMQDEFKRAMHNATGGDVQCTFELALGDLNEQANAVFDAEDVLPDRVQTVDKATIYLAYNSQQSEIVAEHSNFVISFMNTRGQYPVRTGARVMRVWANGCAGTSVTPADIPRQVQLALLLRTKNVLATLNHLIATAQAQGLQAQPRVKFEKAYEQPSGATN